MKNVKRRLPVLLSILLVFALALAACAGDGNGAQDAEETPGGLEETVGAAEGLDANLDETPAAEETLGALEEGAAGDETGMDLNRVTNLLDHNVVGAAGEDLGSIDSLLVDTQNGQVVYALLQAGADLDIENDLVAVPWSQMSFEEAAMDAEAGEAAATEGAMAQPSEAQVVYTGDLATLQSAPSFASDDLGDADFFAADLESELATFWSNEVAELPQTGAEETGAGLFRLDDVEDKQLTNTEGEDLGDIEDMILDPSQGTITYVIVASGGLLDIGEELIPVPFERFQFQPDEQDVNESDIVLNVDQTDLENSPRFPNADEIPDTDEPDWDAEFRSYWESIESSVEDATDTDN